MGNIKNNYAFIDGQNLYLGVTTGKDKWIINFKKFRIYLKEKYNVNKAYYFMGHIIDENNVLYEKLQEAGFIVVFKKQVENMKSTKKGNVDSDLIFNVMKKLIIEPNDFNKIVLVSGDGDFNILANFLIEQKRFEKILFPNKKFTSSLYKSLKIIYKDYLTNFKTKIEYKKKRSFLKH